MNAWKLLHLKIENGVGYLLLDNGGRFNTLHSECLHELSRALDVLEKEAQVGCIVLTGYPGESFAVGASIVEMRDFQPFDAWNFSRLGQGVFEQLEASPKPVICALNGITMGGGCDLALACDIRLASDQLTIAHPGAKLGIITGFCGTQKLPRIVGRNKGKEIFMTSRVYSAAEALQMKLVEDVYPAADFWQKVRTYAEQIAAQPPMALHLIKKLLNAAENSCLANGQVMELGAFASLFPRSGRMERIELFFDQHSPIDTSD